MALGPLNKQYNMTPTIYFGGVKRQIKVSKAYFNIDGWRQLAIDYCTVGKRGWI